MSQDAFSSLIAKGAEALRTIPKQAILRVVSHLDTDGICAASILLHALHKDNRTYQLSILPTLDEPSMRRLAEEETKYYVFTDLGSGQLSLLKTYLPDKNIIILDHHVPEESTEGFPNIIHINPSLVGIDGSQGISGAGVVYHVVHAWLHTKEMAHIGVIGAIGDVQDKGGFSKYNQLMVEHAKEAGNLDVKKGLRFFGMQTRPLHKLLEYSTDVYIPGVTGSESGAIQFLLSLDINPKVDNYWKKLSDLTTEEQKRLATGIILKRKEEGAPDDIFSPIYILKNEKEGSPLRDAKEFSTLLNACGRLDKASVGIGVCLNNAPIKAKALKTLHLYKRTIMQALQWFQQQGEDSPAVQKEERFMIINAETHVLATIIGTMASILSKSGQYPDGYLILSMAKNESRQIKLSLRVAGKRPDHLNLKEIAALIIERTGVGQAGGHVFAAGAVIPAEAEIDCLRASKEVLSEVLQEERII